MQLTRLGILALLASALTASACIPEALGQGKVSSEEPSSAPPTLPTVAAEPTPEPPPTKTVGQIYDSGVVITISLASQRMHVFRNGALWRSSPVSTGKRGKRTPTGVFAILQKKRFHRSNIYSNAPMPYMQRLTWRGIAIHAGRLPGYPASHGCIRIPAAFASELFKITSPAATAVVIVEEPLEGEAEAMKVARMNDTVVPIDPVLLLRERAKLAEPVTPSPSPPTPTPTPTASPPAGVQTIQLAALLSSKLAATHWEVLKAQRPELRGMQMNIVPAVVNGTQYYRLRVSAPDAHGRCAALKRAGVACFPVG